jgi:hypothetical protein
MMLAGLAPYARAGLGLPVPTNKSAPLGQGSIPRKAPARRKMVVITRQWPPSSPVAAGGKKTPNNPAPLIGQGPASSAGLVPTTVLWQTRTSPHSTRWGQPSPARRARPFADPRIRLAVVPVVSHNVSGHVFRSGRMAALSRCGESSPEVGSGHPAWTMRCPVRGNINAQVAGRAFNMPLPVGREGDAVDQVSQPIGLQQLGARAVSMRLLKPTRWHKGGPAKCK